MIRLRRPARPGRFSRNRPGSDRTLTGPAVAPPSADLRSLPRRFRSIANTLFLQSEWVLRTRISTRMVRLPRWRLKSTPSRVYTRSTNRRKLNSFGFGTAARAKCNSACLFSKYLRCSWWPLATSNSRSIASLASWWGSTFRSAASSISARIPLFSPSSVPRKPCVRRLRKRCALGAAPNRE